LVLAKNKKKERDGESIAYAGAFDCAAQKKPNETKPSPPPKNTTPSTSRKYNTHNRWRQQPFLKHPQHQTQPTATSQKVARGGISSGTRHLASACSRGVYQSEPCHSCCPHRRRAQPCLQISALTRQAQHHHLCQLRPRWPAQFPRCQHTPRRVARQQPRQRQPQPPSQLRR